jgi:hypothetical protein
VPVGETKAPNSIWTPPPVNDEHARPRGKQTETQEGRETRPSPKRPATNRELDQQISAEILVGNPTELSSTRFAADSVA